MNNIIENNYASAKPEVGMGVTELCYSDRHPYTIIEIINAKKVVVQGDKAVRTDKNGMSDAQSYEYSANPEGRVLTLTLRTDGHWRAVGAGKGSNVFMIGRRSAYHDYSF